MAVTLTVGATYRSLVGILAAIPTESAQPPDLTIGGCVACALPASTTEAPEASKERDMMSPKLAALAIVTALAAAPAQADVIYSFTTTSATTTYTDRNALPLTAELRLRDEAVASGSFIYSSTIGRFPEEPFTPRGDVSGFVSLIIQSGRFTPTFSPGSINIGLIFDEIGNIASTLIRFRGISDEANVGGFDSTVTGTLGSDRSECNGGADQARCSFTGFWTFASVPDAPPVVTPTPVPEPMSLALFGVGLAGLGLVRRKRAV